MKSLEFWLLSLDFIEVTIDRNTHILKFESVREVKWRFLCISLWSYYVLAHPRWHVQPKTKLIPFDFHCFCFWLHKQACMHNHPMWTLDLPRYVGAISDGNFPLIFNRNCSFDFRHNTTTMQCRKCLANYRNSTRRGCEIFATSWSTRRTSRRKWSPLSTNVWTELSRLPTRLTRKRWDDTSSYLAN